jgi:phosphatidylserine/phosphatidylglycerophosphate/cardiolipin synthase-like enzyme
MKTLFILIFLQILVLQGFSQTITIQEARNKAEGTTVTIKGIAINGDEMGVIRYIQDETAGIAAYSSSLSDVKRGDEVTITGTLKDYNSLLELDPVSSVTINSSNNELPQPALITPSQLAEEYEAELVEIKDVVFDNGGGTFAGNTTYSFTANGETAKIYVKSGSSLDGEIIPSGKVKLIGICSQYSYSNPNSGYQLLLRDMGDIQNNASIYMTSVITMSNLSTTGFNLHWTTNTNGTTQLIYGSSESTMNDTLTGTDNTANHTISITGAAPSQLFFVKAMSTDGNDTAFSQVQVFITKSTSSGDIKIYFNTETEDTASNGTLAVTLYRAIDDTLIQYINRAEETIDLAIYNINNTGISNITDALNNAYARGVKIRIVHDGSTACLGLDNLNSNIHTIASPTTSGYGIMHNKFMIIDADASDAGKPLVWTGSTNFTDDNINKDANNVVIIQDKSLAQAYKLEFEEMWGSQTLVPDQNNAKFGPYKTDNTPHQFIIGENNIELYFSPSDQTNKHLIECINSAESDLSIETMLITRSDIAYAIRDVNRNGVATSVITNAENQNSSYVNQVLEDELKVHYTFDDVSDGILHNKFMIVDQSNQNSDPLVWTGSHNWSNSANNINDENTLVIHNSSIANQYYQQFVYRFIENEGSFVDIDEPPVAVNDTVNVEKNGSVLVDVLSNDIYTSDVTVKITENASHGNSEIPFTTPSSIKYTPDTGFTGNDTITYKISYNVDSELYGIGKVLITVGGNGVYSVQKLLFSVYPNPNNGNFVINIDNNLKSTVVKLFDIQGKEIYSYVVKNNLSHINLSFNDIEKGTYFIEVISGNNIDTKKIIIN